MANLILMGTKTGARIMLDNQDGTTPRAMLVDVVDPKNVAAQKAFLTDESPRPGYYAPAGMINVDAGVGLGLKYAGAYGTETLEPGKLLAIAVTERAKAIGRTLIPLPADGETVVVPLAMITAAGIDGLRLDHFSRMLASLTS